MKRWKIGPSKIQAATLEMPPCCPGCSTKFRPNRRLPASPPTAHKTPENAARQLLPVRLMPSFHPQERQTLEANKRGCHRAKRKCVGRKISGPRPMATVDVVLSPELGRDKNALYHTARPKPHGAELRPAGRGDSGPHHRAQPIHSSGRTKYRGHRVGLSGERKPRPSEDSCNKADPGS